MTVETPGWRPPRIETAQEAAVAAWLTEAAKSGIFAGHFRPDRIVISSDGSLFALELKRQKRYRCARYGGDFDGHGMSPLQFANLDALATAGLRVLFVVEEPDTDLDFCQWLDILAAGECHVTLRDPRVIWPLSAFTRSRFPRSASADLTPGVFR